jgi:hypothetical protein
VIKRTQSSNARIFNNDLNQKEGGKRRVKQQKIWRNNR